MGRISKDLLLRVIWAAGGESGRVCFAAKWKLYEDNQNIIRNSRDYGPLDSSPSTSPVHQQFGGLLSLRW